jgi:hypothetical protein
MKLESDILRGIGAISRCVQTLTDGLLKPRNLERGQFYFLTRVCENEGINPVDLATCSRWTRRRRRRRFRSWKKRVWSRERATQAIKGCGGSTRRGRAGPVRAHHREENENVSVCFAGFTEAEKSTAQALIKRMEKNMERKWEALKGTAGSERDRKGGDNHG